MVKINFPHVLGKNLRKLSRSGLYALAMMFSAAAGGFTTSLVRASIPDSNTGNVTLCSLNTTGAVRAVDAQSGTNCTGLETPLTLPSASRSASISNVWLNSAGVVDSSYSTNVTSSTTVQVRATTYWLCLQLNFTPKFAFSTNSGDAVGGTIRLTGAPAAGGMPGECGSPYNAAVMFDNSAPTQYGYTFIN